MIEAIKHVIELHLERSQNAPLTCFVSVCLEGPYDTALPHEIVKLLSEHQKRWRRVGIDFDVAIDDKLMMRESRIYDSDSDSQWL